MVVCKKLHDQVAQLLKGILSKAPQFPKYYYSDPAYYLLIMDNYNLDMHSMAITKKDIDKHRIIIEIKRQDITHLLQ